MRWKILRHLFTPGITWKQVGRSKKDALQKYKDLQSSKLLHLDSVFGTKYLIAVGRAYEASKSLNDRSITEYGYGVTKEPFSLVEYDSAEGTTDQIRMINHSSLLLLLVCLAFGHILASFTVFYRAMLDGPQPLNPRPGLSNFEASVFPALVTHPVVASIMSHLSIPPSSTACSSNTFLPPNHTYSS